MKTDELEAGRLLDVAVARALGMKSNAIRTNDGLPVFMSCDAPRELDLGTAIEDPYFGDDFEPSTRWDHGGPVMQRERISLITVTVNWGSAPPAWIANVIGKPQPYATGRTMLEAGMRAFVKNMLGDEVELP